jgi:hypothetical protein
VSLCGTRREDNVGQGRDDHEDENREPDPRHHIGIKSCSCKLPSVVAVGENIPSEYLQSVIGQGKQHEMDSSPTSKGWHQRPLSSIQS